MFYSSMRIDIEYEFASFTSICSQNTSQTKKQNPDSKTHMILAFPFPQLGGLNQTRTILKKN